MIHRARSRERIVSVEQLSGDWEALSSTPEERVVDLEAFRRDREALMRIGVTQARCLLLRAEGLSYDEIAAETKLSYAQVHRSLCEGRRVMRGVVSRIEDGSECRRIEPLLSKFADHEADDAERSDVELHITNCSACRAELREGAELPSAFAAAFPVGAALSAASGGSSLTGWVADVWSMLIDRVCALAPASSSAEFVAGKKIAAASLLAGALLVGGVGLEQAVHDRSGGLDEPGARRAGSAAGKTVGRDRAAAGWPFRIPAEGGTVSGSKAPNAHRDDSIVPLDDGIVSDSTSPEAPRDEPTEDFDSNEPEPDPPPSAPTETGGEQTPIGDVVAVE